jgi:hypothetical protein
MKILYFYTLLITTLLLLSCDGSSDTTSFSLQEPDYEYEIDTWGKNSEIYEITPKSNPNYSCLIFILDNLNSASMQCFPKPNKH